MLFPQGLLEGFAGGFPVHLPQLQIAIFVTREEIVSLGTKGKARHGGLGRQGSGSIALGSPKVGLVSVTEG